MAVCWFLACSLSGDTLAASEPKAIELPAPIDSRFEARDSLSRGEESSVDANLCLDGLCWNNADFQVAIEAAKPGFGDCLVRFPSPITTDNPINDQVAMEWYVARDQDHHPLKAKSVIVVHESGKGMTVGRLIARGLQMHGLHAFMLQLPGYGARRGDAPVETEKMLKALQQGVADVRRARDAVAVLPQVDTSTIGLQGTSLGGFVCATVAGLDRGYDRVYILLAGGNLHEVVQQGKKDAAKYRERLESIGVVGEKLLEITRVIEPMRLAHRIDPQTTWLYRGRFDDVVPPQCSIALAEAARLPEDHHIVMAADHYSGVIFLPTVLAAIDTTMETQVDASTSIPPEVTELFEKLTPELPILAKSPKELERIADQLEEQYRDRPSEMPEAFRMLIDIARGSQMGPGEGWFGPAQSQYDFDSLSETLQLLPNEAITREKFPGKDLWFQRLDRDQNGTIDADDFDWSDGHPYLQAAGMVNRFFRSIDQKDDGKVTQEEVLQFFDRLRAGGDGFTSDQLRRALLKQSGGFLPGDAPTQEQLVRGLFGSEIGSLGEGPQLGEQAPDFTLKLQDGSDSIQLSKQWGNGKPTVLVFGNFTCGPFRRNFPEIEEIYQRYKEEADFLSVYVREAHPSDGWMMESNTQSGVRFAQPKNYEERVEIAQQCHTKLNYTMPLLVDELNDQVGNAYSGMPSRLYVLDDQGVVVYKSGRGPFGFRSGEMEQALLLTLFNAAHKAKR